MKGRDESCRRSHCQEHLALVSKPLRPIASAGNQRVPLAVGRRRTRRSHADYLAAPGPAVRAPGRNSRLIGVASQTFAVWSLLAVTIRARRD